MGGRERRGKTGTRGKKKRERSIDDAGDGDERRQKTIERLDDSQWEEGGEDSDAPTRGGEEGGRHRRSDDHRKHNSDDTQETLRKTPKGRTWRRKCTNTTQAHHNTTLHNTTPHSCHTPNDSLIH